MGIKIKYERGCFSGEIFLEQDFEEYETFGASLKKIIDTLNGKNTAGMSSRVEKSEKPKEDDNREVGSMDEFLAWCATQNEHHSIRGADMRAPFANTETLARDAIKQGFLELREVLFVPRSIKGPGEYMTMKALHFPNEPHQPVPTYDEAEDIIVDWITQHPGYIRKTITDRCGVIRSIAGPALQQALEARRIKGKDAKFYPPDHPTVSGV